MKFSKGQSGNPSGRPCGARGKSAQLRNLLNPYAKDLIQKAVEMAQHGDQQMLRLCIERLIPKATHEAIQLELPQDGLDNPEALLELGARIIRAVANGEMTPEDGHRLSGLVQAQSQSIQIAELGDQLKQLQSVVYKKK